MFENLKMRNWESILKSDTLDWLLEKNNPSVRYFTLIDILDYPITNSEVIEAKNDIMQGKLVSRILSKQNEQGYWEKPKNFYRTKYKGTVWHYQNGEVVLEYHLWTPEWNELVAGSKFPAFNPDWANVASEGLIGLQDHGDDVWFKNIKIKFIKF